MRPVRDSLSALVLFAVMLLIPAAEPAAAEDGLFERQTLTGDWGGMRKTLRDAGIDLGVIDTSEMLQPRWRHKTGNNLPGVARDNSQS